MASEQLRGDNVGAALKESSKRAKEAVESIDTTLESAEVNLASIRDTINAIDSFEARWKDVTKKFGEAIALSLSSALGVERPCTLSEREKLSVFGGNPNINALCKRLSEGFYKKVIVMTGAGISVSAGIPDFRSPKSGLYDSLDSEKYQLPSPQAVFNIDFFRDNPKPFFLLRKEMFSKTYSPTPAHYFIKLLSDKGLLQRCYTQNIDGLEKKAGLPNDLLVQAHGTIEEATCTNPDCKKKFPSAQMKQMVEAAVSKDKVPTCDLCGVGVIKPDVVFFGEDLPKRFKDLLETSFEECDLLIVMGTSLKVQPFCSLVQRVKETTPRLLINKERVGNFVLESEGGYRDIAMLEECDKAVSNICTLCNWTQDLDKLVRQSKRQHQTPKSSTSLANKISSSRPSYQATKAAPTKEHATRQETTQHTASKTKTAFKSSYVPKSQKK